MSLFEKLGITQQKSKKQDIVTVFNEEHITVNLDNEQKARQQEEEARGREVAKRINTFFELHNIQAGPTVLPAVKLYFLRETTVRPGTNEGELVAKLNFLADRLNKKESELARPQNPLPTVGIEVELPDKTFPLALKTALPLIGIHCELENSELFEINPTPTYSAEAQNEIIENINALGLAPHQPELPLSLHINFCAKTSISAGNLESNKAKIYLLSNLFVYAFSSAERVLEKEIKKPFLFKTATPIHQHDNLNKGKTGEIKKFQPRVEFRATEFGDYSTYRLLTESQRIMGMFFTSLTRVAPPQPGASSGTQERLLLLWEEFEKEATQLLYEEEAIKPRLIEDNKKSASEIIRSSPELRKKCRSLMTKYSQQIQGILKEAA